MTGGSHLYKLFYFNIRGRAECVRLLFAEAGVNYEDFRFEQNEWPRIKPKIPFGQVPALEIDNKYIITQTKSICRYLGKQFGMNGKSALESAYCDSYVDFVDDKTSNLISWWNEPDPEKKKRLWDEFLRDNWKPLLKEFENILHRTGTGLLIGNQVTWADLYLFDNISFFNIQNPELLEPHPKLIQYIGRIQNLPNIKRWIEKRPKTEM